MADRPAADWPTGPNVARAVLATLDLAGDPLSLLGEGWDNTSYRVDDADGPRVLRLPRRRVAVQLLRHEHRWLPELAPRLPLPVPAPITTGEPVDGFPAPWSVVPWFPGEPADRAGHVEGLADDLAGFFRALHGPAPAEAPHNPFRGLPIAERGKRLRANLEVLRPRLGAQVDRLWRVFVRACDAPRQPTPLWLHGDTHPGNLLVHEGRLSAVIDWGDVCRGDPASDLANAWMLFADDDLARFFDTYRADAATVERARGWAVALAVAYAASSDDDPAFHRMARRALDRLAG